MVEDGGRARILARKQLTDIVARVFRNGYVPNLLVTVIAGVNLRRRESVVDSYTRHALRNQTESQVQLTSTSDGSPATIAAAQTTRIIRAFILVDIRPRSA